MRYVTCNGCGSDSYDTKYMVGEMRLVRCTSCGLCYFNPRPDEAELREIYQGDYFNNRSFFQQRDFIYGYQDYVADRVNIQQDFEGKAEKIGKYVSGGKVLDVGCAHGYFLELMAKRGFDAEGVEINRDAVECASKLGLKVSQGTFEDMGYKEESYDLVTMFDVIEHMLDPRAVLNKAHQLLKPGGIMVLSTVDIDSLVARLLGPRWEEVRRSRTHLWLFSRKTVERLAALCNYDLLEVTPYGKIFELGFALRRAAPYSPRLFNALYLLTRTAGVDRVKVYIDVRTKLCYYLRKPWK